MKKILSIIIFLLLITTVNVNANTTITKTDYKNGKISVQGTGEGEVQIVLFDLNNEPLFMTTVTTENGKFEITFPPIANLKEGTYKIKVSDYSGQKTSSGEVIIKAEETPQTIDKIFIYITLSTLSLTGLTFSARYLYKKIKNSTI